MPDQVRFTETMSGYVAPLVGQTHEVAEATGRAHRNDLLFTLTVVTDDVDAMVVDPDHRSPAFGVVLAPGLHPRPLGVVTGHLDLFADAAPGVLHMRYGLQLVDADGRRLYLRGLKEVVRRAPWPTVSADTTTLFIDVWDGDAPTGEPAWRGVLRMGPLGVSMQGLSFRGRGGWWGLRGIVNYLGYYVRRVWAIYTGPRGTGTRSG
jgi:hypothetical protein